MDSIFLSAVKSAVVIGGDLKYSDGSAVGLDASGIRAIPMSISTAKGQTYQLVLADGTKVWLNAGSKLDFPSSFEGSNSRIVTFSGEGYFEVSPDRAHPFIVRSPSQHVEVLGTRFNISDYKGQGSALTSVLEGSVQISPVLESINQGPAAKRGAENKPLILKAGQQFVLTKDFQKLLKVDEKVALAWKAGSFYFHSENILQVMNKIAYWYDVEVVYVNEKRSAGGLLTGQFDRSRKLSEVLHLISTVMGLQFRIEGRKVYVE